MKEININEAERDYSCAWSNVKEQMAHLKQVSDADIVPFSAAVIDVKGMPMLEVYCLTDLVAVGSDESANGMRFRAAIHDPSALKNLH
jgi:hypothetical protein